MSYQDCTAAELAGMLDGMERFPHNTGGLSMLDEATMAFGRKDAGLTALQRAFADARYAHKRSWSTEAQAYSDEAWRAAMTAAHSLAAALRPLGDVRIARCKRPAGWGTCNLPLDGDGQCRSTLGHTDPAGRWTALRDHITEERTTQDQAAEYGRDDQSERAFGRVEAYDELLATMDRMEAGQ